MALFLNQSLRPFFEHDALAATSASLVFGRGLGAGEGFAVRCRRRRTRLRLIARSALPESDCRLRAKIGFVIAADVYAKSPHEGRGGWSWYTGSAGWMYRLVTETLLGLKLEGDKLHIYPRVPKAWPSFKLHYRYRETTYRITLKKSAGVASNGAGPLKELQQLSGKTIDLVDDRQEHQIEIEYTLPS